jgi:hypothetical protein
MENQAKAQPENISPKSTKNIFAKKPGIIIAIGIIVLLFTASATGAVLYVRNELRDNEDKQDTSTMTDSQDQNSNANRPRITPTEPGTQNDAPGSKQVTLTESGYKLNLRYTGSNSWEYSITGDLPTPCHKTNVETIIQESYPEKAIITLEITRPTGMCIQVIDPITLTGSIQVSAEAEFDFVVS